MGFSNCVEVVFDVSFGRKTGNIITKNRTVYQEL